MNSRQKYQEFLQSSADCQFQQEQVKLHKKQ